MASPNIIQVAKLVAVPLPWAMFGYCLSFSQNSVPALYDYPPETSTPIFSEIFYSGATIALPSILLSSASSAFLAYSVPARRVEWGSAAAAILLFLPYTGLRMLPGGITRLLDISKSKVLQEKTGATLEHRQLLKKWVRQNYVRAAIAFTGGVLALRAAFLP